ncbi:hypothetical protein GLYMA_10G010750v4 [Glycine max]|nr:hypothetical protein GLYMA_10G010750v4 [Glycine max]KAH1136185.1 hypothetical protein GYH30_026599 [Glycine max]
MAFGVSYTFWHWLLTWSLLDAVGVRFHSTQTFGRKGLEQGSRGNFSKDNSLANGYPVLDCWRCL